MKKLAAIVKIYFIALNAILSFAQKSNLVDTYDIKIDPRQYVSVEYRKLLSRDKLDTLWNWESRLRVPNQKIQYVDIDGEIRVNFDKHMLSQNKDFEGVVSLEAEISGANGTRKIEVNPYSEIGVQRIPIGIKSEAPYEISKKLINMIKEVSEADSIYNFISIYGSFTNETLEDNKTISSKSKDLFRLLGNNANATSKLIPLAVEIYKIIDPASMYYDSVSTYYKPIMTRINSSRNNTELSNAFTDLLNRYKYNYNYDKTNFINLFREALKYSTKKTDLVIDYLSSFESAGEDATKAFFSLINKDLIGYKAIKMNLINSQKRLVAIDLNKQNLDSILVKNSSLIIESCKSLSELSRFKGSTFENILNDIARKNNSPYNPERYKTKRAPGISPLDSNYISNSQKYLEKQKYYYDLIDTHLQEISENLSEAAGRIIYKKLIYATIDLGKSGAKSGEVLNIYLTWILNSKKDSLSNSPRLPIGKYYLRETGWRVEIADMFSLVKRSNETAVNINPTTISPSNFKGAGGAVLMWTFNKEDRGLTINKGDHGEYIIKGKNRFSNFLEPSFGLNITYLDFSTEKDVEIGTGLQMGLFRNKIFFGYGVNLHMLSPKNQSPGYFFIGFSFARLSDLFKNSNNIVSSQ